MIQTTHEYRLGPLSEIPPGEGREFDIAGQAIAVFHTRGGDGVYATQAFCPHRQGPLIDGLIGGTTLLCPLHAWKFDLKTGEALMGTCGLETYPVRLDGDEIVLTLVLGDAAIGPAVTA
jgi:nitrite reductase (NADH) small subunit